MLVSAGFDVILSPFRVCDIQIFRFESKAREREKERNEIEKEKTFITVETFPYIRRTLLLLAIGP